MTPDPDDLLARQLRQLRAEYLRDSGQCVEELRRLRARLAQVQRPALADLRQAFHRLAGSGGSYGFPAVSTHSREGEQLALRLYTAEAPLSAEDLAALDASIEAVASAFQEASASLGSDRESQTS